MYARVDYHEYEFDNTKFINRYFDKAFERVLGKFILYFGFNDRVQAHSFLEKVMQDYDKYDEDSDYYDDLKSLKMNKRWITAYVLNKNGLKNILADEYINLSYVNYVMD